MHPMLSHVQVNTQVWTFSQ